MKAMINMEASPVLNEMGFSYFFLPFFTQILWLLRFFWYLLLQMNSVHELHHFTLTEDEKSKKEMRPIDKKLK